MERRILELEVPDKLYQELYEQPDPVRAAALASAVQAVRDYLRREAGRHMLRQLPEDAYAIQDNGPANLAEAHDAYL